MSQVDGLLIDIDGVLSVSWVAIDGAPGALSALRDLGVPLRFATNTTTRTRREVAALLTVAGMAVDLDEILTAPVPLPPTCGATTRERSASSSTLATCPRTWRALTLWTMPTTVSWTWWWLAVPA